jgi:hypothetical protein
LVKPLVAGLRARASAGLKRSVGDVSRISFRVASVALDGEIIAGSLPSRATALVAGWATLHSTELEANWARAGREESLEAIEPLP